MEESPVQARVGTLSVSLLGTFEVTLAGRTITGADWPRRRAGDLVKLLALAPERQLHADQIVTALWPDSSASAARQSLHNSLYHARRVLDPGYTRGGEPRFLAFSAEVVRLSCADPVEIDVVAFEQAAQDALADADPAALRGASQLYGGELLPEDRFVDWAADRRDELRGLQLRVLTRLAVAQRERGELDLAIAELSKATALDPLYEAAQSQLIRTYAAAGLRHQAIVQYRRFVTRLNRELGERPSAELVACFEEIADPSLPPPSATPTGRRRALPAEIGRFVGRSAELGRLAALVGEERLVTLLGAGGVGKTRLAVEAAKQRRDEAVTFVELADLGDGSLVGQAVCEALGAAEQPGASPIEVATSLLADDRSLVVLDTCEHVLAGAASVATQLLRACPGLRILATSRQALGVPGETVHLVRPLELPEDPEDPVGALRSDAVQLFLERSRALNGGSALDGPRIRAIVELCRRVDGIPLGIELAAARARALPVDQLIERLDAWLPLLESEGDEQGDRQRTLRATIGWSYRLLSPQARLVLARLSAFSGSWSIEAAEAVVPGGELDAEDFLAALAELVDKSLVGLEERRGRARYRLLDTVREYGRQQLAATGDRQELRARHARAFAVELERVDTRSLPVTAIAEGWLDDITDDLENIRSALEWALLDGDRALGRRLALSMRWYWSERCQFTEGRRWIAAALDGLDDPGPAAALLVGHGLLAWRQGDFEASVEATTRGLELARAASDRWAEALGLTLVATVRQMSDDVEGGRPLNEAALAIYRELGDVYGATWQLAVLARGAIVRGDPADGERLAREGLAISQAGGDRPGAGWALSYIGVAQAATGRLDAAVTTLRDAHGLLSEHDWWGGDVVAAVLLRASALAGNASVGAGPCIAALDRLSRFGSPVELRAALHCVAVAAEASGDLDLATTLLGVAHGDDRAAPTAAALVDPSSYAHDLERIRSRSSAVAFARAFEAGRTAPLRDGVEAARRLLRSLR